MSVMSSLSRHVFHPLWDLKDGSARLRVLRQLQRSQWLPEATLRARQRERLQHILAYAGTHSPYYARLFRDHRVDAAHFDADAFAQLPRLTKAIIRNSSAEILSREFARTVLGQHKTGGSTGVAPHHLL